MKSTLSIKIVLFCIMVFAMCGSAFSQVGGDGPPIGPNPPVPITGIELLIGAGALLGIRKLMRSKKGNK